MARTFGAQGMNVVLADIEPDALEARAEELRSGGVACEAVTVDVGDGGAVEALERRSRERFGDIHVLCNNAGVFTGGLAWEVTAEDYDWLLRVNLWGVIHGTRAFVPNMLAQSGRSHVVNTASMAAVTTMPYVAGYHLTKHAVLAFSESLYHELTLAGAPVSVSVLCPEGVATRIHEADRNRPSDAGAKTAGAEHGLVMQAVSEQSRDGLDPLVLAERTLQAIREDRFYILSEDYWREACNVRLEDVKNARNPTFYPPS